MVRAAQKTDAIDLSGDVVNYVRRVTSIPEATVGARLALCTTTRPTPKGPVRENGSPMVPPRSPRGAHARCVEGIDLGEAWSAMKARPPPF